ncbi:MAG TPA: AMP-binding protein [Acidimicrobiia bacterium]|nr:AMP-binding protein [Acidimicrobiia bacterium]
MTTTTIADLFLRNAATDGVGAWFEDRSYTYREIVAEGRRRAALWDGVRDPERPPHIGVLLDNTPEYLFWLAAAAISRSVVVGINSTYRGAELARLIDHCDCQLLVTSDAYGELLADAPSRVAGDHVLVTGSERYAAQLGSADPACEWDPARPDDLYLLIFTSGSTGFPKAVRCTQGRLVRTGQHVAGVAELGPGSAVYAPLPFFYSSALFTGLASALYACAPIGTRARFSASRAMPDVRRMGATLMAYTGKTLNYILAVPPSPDDATSPLRLALGNEASESDIREFARRFDCSVRDSYGSTEGMIIIRRDPSMPPGSIGRGDDDIAVYDPATGAECPPAELDADGRLVNAEKAVGEIVNLAPGEGFEGYYRNEEARASKVRGGIYWSGDLAYRDADGWFFFAGRSNDWLRVDGENFAAGPVESIVMRYPGVRSAAVYAVPDDPVGDRVMVALEVIDPDAFAVSDFDAFLARQRDLGPKWVPSFVRVTGELPKLASMKIDKTRLRREAWLEAGVAWRPARGEPLRPLTPADRDSLAHLLSPGTGRGTLRGR